MGTHCWGSEASPGSVALFRSVWVGWGAWLVLGPGWSAPCWVVGGVGLLFEMWIVDASITMCSGGRMWSHLVLSRPQVSPGRAVVGTGVGCVVLFDLKWREFICGVSWPVVSFVAALAGPVLLGSVGVWCGVLVLGGQAVKGTWWMPWHREPMKDVGACDKPWGVGNRAVIRGCPNGETQLESCPVTCA